METQEMDVVQSQSIVADDEQAVQELNSIQLALVGGGVGIVVVQ